MAGRALTVECQPALPRAAVRAARLVDARRRREASPGFLRVGGRLDPEGRASLTPEALALAMSADALGSGVREVWDLGCGAGGNALGFARQGARVTAVERERSRLEDARHNANLYGVAERVRFVEADATAWLAAQPVEAGTLLFVDPPWGLDWDRHRCVAEAFPLLVAVAALRGPRSLLAKVPSSFDPSSLGPASLGPASLGPASVGPASLGPAATARAYFGVAPGDAQRVKFVTVLLPPA